MTDSVLVMKKRELSFLMSCRGSRKYAGLMLETPLKEQMQELVENMYQKGWLVNNGAHFRVNGRLVEMIDRITEAKEVFFLFSGKKELPLCCLYPGKRALIMQEARVRPECVLLQWVEEDLLVSFFQEIGWPLSVDKENRDAILNAELPPFPEGVTDRKALKEFPAIQIVVQRVEKETGEVAEQYCICRKGLYDYLIGQDMETGTYSAVPLTLERLRKIWEEKG